METTLGIVKVVHCPDQDMDTPLCDCLGCDYCGTVDEDNEYMICTFGGE